MPLCRKSNGFDLAAFSFPESRTSRSMPAIFVIVVFTRGASLKAWSPPFRSLSILRLSSGGEGRMRERRAIRGLALACARQKEHSDCDKDAGPNGPQVRRSFGKREVTS